MSDHEEVDEAKETLEIQNVVASTAIGQELDLQSVALDFKGADFDPDQFPGLIYRELDSHATALISGRARSSVQARSLSQGFTRQSRTSLRNSPTSESK